MVKNRLPVQETQETQVRSLGREDPLEWEMATQFTVLAWKILWTEESWWATVHGVAELDTAKQLSTHSNEKFTPENKSCWGVSKRLCKALFRVVSVIGKEMVIHQFLCLFGWRSPPVVLITWHFCLCFRGLRMVLHQRDSGNREGQLLR